MEKIHSNKRDYSLLFMAVVIVATLLLSGCNFTNTDSGTSSDSPTSIIPEARADYEEGEFQSYSKEAYDKAVADGKMVFLDFHADWCSVCVKNAPTIKKAFDAPFADDVVGFKVDYDKEVALKKEHSVTSQATLILLDGNIELKRVMGPQTLESFETFINNEVVEEAEKVTLKESVETQVASTYKAGAMQDFSKSVFDDAIADGKTVLLDFHADWCGVCVGNAPIIKDALGKDGDVVGFMINYDKAHDLIAKYGVVSQSTLVLLKGDKELTRAMGPQTAATMTTLLNS